VYTRNTLIEVESHGWHGPSSYVTIQGCSLVSVNDASSWTASDWDTLSCNGIMVSGNWMTITGNQCRNINFGISVNGNNATVRSNVIANFAGDGLRGLGDDLLFE